MKDLLFFSFLLVDICCFVAITAWVLYLFVFSLFSRRKSPKDYPEAPSLNRFVVLFPAYKEDSVIKESVKNFLEQDYPSEFYELIVISDGMQPETVDLLRQTGATVYVVDFERSSKAKALNFAMKKLKESSFDVVAILDADNHVTSDFLRKLNNAYNSGVRAMQAHRVAKNSNSDVAQLDGISEEINNSIFRKGHVNAGLSSALIGSGMAFDFEWFRTNIDRVNSVGEDKELELLLLLDGIRIDYLERVLVWDEKVQSSKVFSQQRQRWISAQFVALSIGIHHFFRNVHARRLNYIAKLFQWTMPPRLLLVGGIPVIIIVFSLIHLPVVYKWIFVYLLLLLALRLAIPTGLFNQNIKHAIKKLPQLFIQMIFSFLKINKNKDQFIHTPHGEEK